MSKILVGSIKGEDGAPGQPGPPGAPGVVRVTVVTGAEPRPAGDFCIWFGGTTRPTFMVDGDLWFQAGPTVPTPPTIVSTGLNTLTQGAAFSQTLTASGTTPITWAVTAGSLPAGITLSSGGVLSGTPTTAGAYNFTVTAANSQGQDSRVYAGTVTASAVAPTITTTTLGALTQGAPFSQTLQATGTGPITFTVPGGSLPAGLTLSSSGVLSGTPTGSGAYSFTVTANGPGGSDTQTYSGTITAGAVAPVITTTALNSLTAGAAFSQTLDVSGSTPITWSLVSGALPAGLTLNTSTGAIVGTPTAAGSYAFTLQAANSAGSDTQAFSGTVSSSATAPTITTTVLDDLTEGVAFSQTLARTGSTPITWGVSEGSLPAGLSINSSTGAISGTPTAPGAYSFTVQATNSAGSDTQEFTGTVAAAPPPVSGVSIFDTTNPGNGGTVHNDGGGSIRTGVRFYTTRPGGITIIGARVWNPASADSAFLNADVTVYAYLNDWTGSFVTAATTFGGTPAQSKAHAATREAGTWTNIAFDAPITLNPIAAGGTANDLLTIAVQFAGGTYYTFIEMGFTNSTTYESLMAAGADVYIAEHDAIIRSIHNLGGGGGASSSGIYGVDLIFQED